MDLKIRRGLSRTHITDSEGNVLFIIKGKSFFSLEKTVL